MHPLLHWTRRLFGSRHAPDADPPRATRWWRLALVISLGVVFAVYVGALIDMDWSTKSKLAALRAEAEALALSVAPERVPDERNAALVYERAFEAMGGYYRWPTLSWYDWTEKADFDPKAPGTQEFLRGKKPIVALLRKAAAMPDYYFETDYTRPFTMRIPDLKRWRDAGKLLILDARSSAAAGDLGAALADIQAVWGMVEHVDSVPTLISCMIAVALDATGSQALEHVLAAAGGGEADAIPGLRGARPSFRESLQRALRTEEACALQCFLAAYGGPRKDLPVGLPGLPPIRKGYRALKFEADLESYREWADKVRSVAQKPLHEMFKEAGEIECPTSGTVTFFVTVSLQGAFFSVVEAEAMRRLADLALSAAAYEAEHGRYPQSLEELLPRYIQTIPADPFSGEPLRMAAADGGLVLYSVYFDGKDDGGAEHDSRERESKGDLIFCLGGAYEKRRREPALERARRREARKRPGTPRSPAAPSLKGPRTGDIIPGGQE